MTNEEAIKIIKSECYTANLLNLDRTRMVNTALDLAIKALEQCEVWNGSHGQIVAPKGTFERIYNDCKDEQQPNYLKKRDGNYVHYNVEWLLKNWQMELDILSDGKIKPCEDCISRQAVKEMLTGEWTKYMPMGLDMNLSFVLEKISELPSVTPKYTDEEIDRAQAVEQAYIDKMVELTVEEWCKNGRK